MNDRRVQALLTAGLLLQAGAIAAGLAGLGWRWPLIGATAVVALVVFALAVPGRRMDTFRRVIAGCTLVALAAVVGHALSADPAAAWSLRIVFGLQALALLALLIFFLTFRLNRLW